MSLPTTYATLCEIHAASEIYPYHLVVILQPDEYLEEKLIFRFKCTGPMMNARFEPLIPLYAPSLPSNVLTVRTSFVSGSTAKPHAKSECQQLSSDNSSIVINEKSRKRKCRSRVNDRTKTQKHREAVKKYTDKNPEVHRKAVKRYNNANPDVHRASVSRYSKNNPKINRDAVQMYNKKRPMIPWKSKCLSGLKYSSTIDY